jgi:formylglycine-generating enzyme
MTDRTRSHPLRLDFALALVLVPAGCMIDLQAPVTFRCSTSDPRCPEGTVCREGLCLAPSTPVADATPDRKVPRAEAAEAARDAGTGEGTQCGNGVLESGEECDGEALGGKTCESLCYSGGSLRCTRRCTLSIASCTVPTAPVKVKAKGVTFDMGSPETEAPRDKGETQHAVSLSHDLLVSPTEVTQEDYLARMGYNPSYIPVSGHPVEEVIWSEAAAYCNALSDEAGLDRCYSSSGTSCPSDLSMCKASGNETLCKQTRCAQLQVSSKYATTAKTITDCPGFRLPTEAEWEFAYRAGTTTATYEGELVYPGGTDPVAERIGWYYYNTSKGTSHAPIALKKPNASCLFDMAGNVWELTNDFWEDDLGSASVKNPTGPSSGYYKVARGGSHYELAREMRAARRVSRYLLLSNVNTGFRCVRSSF